MCDCERPDVCNVVTRKARKAHKCCECGGDIPVGSAYQYISIVFDGTADSFKTCDSCAKVRGAEQAKDRDDCGPCIGDLREWFSEVGESLEDAKAALAASKP